MVAELTVARGAEGSDGDTDPACCARPVRLRLAVRVPQVTALKMELSRVTGSAGSALVRPRSNGCPRVSQLGPGDSFPPVPTRNADVARPRPRQSPSVAEVVGGGCELEVRS